MIDFDGVVDVDWQAKVLRHMCTWQLHAVDPDETFSNWVAEAGQGDEPYIVWAYSRWEKIRTMTSLDVEKLAYQTNLWQAHRNFGSDQQAAP